MAPATAQALPTGRSSAPHTRIFAEDFGLTGPSNLPDPKSHAYRKDLADWALTGRVIASHYAEPLDRVIGSGTSLRTGPSDDSDVMLELKAGESFAMLDNSLGWAWGYAGPERRVGYVRSEAIRS